MLLKALLPDLPSLIDHPVSYKAIKNIFSKVTNPGKIQMIESATLANMKEICQSANGLSFIELIIKTFQADVPALISAVIAKSHMFLMNEQGYCFLKRLVEGSQCFKLSQVRFTLFNFDMIAYMKYGGLLVKDFLWSSPNEIIQRIFLCFRMRFLQLCIHSFELVSTSFNLKGKFLAELFTYEILEPGLLGHLIENQNMSNVLILKASNFLSKRNKALLVKELENFLSLLEENNFKPENIKPAFFLSKLKSLAITLRKRNHDNYYI